MKLKIKRTSLSQNTFFTQKCVFLSIVEANCFEVLTIFCSKKILLPFILDVISLFQYFVLAVFYGF